VAAGTDIEGIERPPKSLWEQIRAEPDRTPELVALAAAERFGPASSRWVEVAGGGKTPEKLAKIAYRKHVRLARLEGGALGLGGAFTAAPDFVALLWIQSRMVFYIAAAYGYDPRDPMRPAELLYLQGLYPTPAEARETLDGEGKRLAQAVAEKAMSSDGPSIQMRVAKYAAKRMAKRYAGRLIPLVGAPIGAVQNAGATKELGRKALAYYGGAQARP
jgi:EcsC family protein